MKLFRNSVRSRKRSSFFEETVAAATQTRTASKTPIGLLLLAQVVGCLLLIVIIGVEGELTSFSCSTSLSSSLGAFSLIYSVFPHYAITKSIRNGQEISVPEVFSSFPQPVPTSSLFSSRTLQVSSEEGNSTASELLDSNSSESSYKMTLLKQFRKSQRKQKGSRLKRQMGMAAEIALIAPALQTMGCIPKFFCGMNSKPPADGTSALNDLAYLIRVAMLDDDDVELELEEPLFAGNTNSKGKHGLSGLKKGVDKIKDDLIIENLAEEELIQEDPANLPFVWQDMEHRIKTKTKPGNKHRFDDEIMDALIVEPEQSSMTAILTGLKSVFRIGRSGDSFGNSSQVTPRSNNSESSRGLREKRQRWRRQWKRPFWKTPQFRQDMELAQRIGKTEQDDTKCSSTFNLCPYTVHEMMEIVHGGYKKQNRKKPEWFLNAEGPPESSEEVILKKPFKDKDNLMTTTTERTQWLPTDPEEQILYAVFPHKAIEKGYTTLPTTRRPTTTSTSKPDKQDASKRRRKNPTKIQHHVEYENQDDDSSKELDPEQMDMAINNKRRRKPWNKNRPPHQQGPHHPHHHQQHHPSHFQPQQHRVPQGRRPMLRPQQPTVFVKQTSNEDMSNDDNENDKSSSEEQAEDKPNDGEGSSEEATQNEEASSPAPPKVVQITPDPISVAPQQQSQPLQPFLQNGNPQQLKNPIALPRPKYKLQRKEKKRQKGRRRPQTPQNNQGDKEVKDDKSKEASEEEDEAEGDEESQENSSEEVKNQDSQSPPQEMSNNAPHPNLNNLRGRPSEEIKGPAQNLLPNTPQASFEEDEPEDSDEKQNSNSGSFEGSTEQELISIEMAKVPKPARQPPPHMRINGSHEYAYSDEANGRPQIRPINYSYFKPPPGQNGGGPPQSPPPQGNQGSQEPPPNSSTQKYSTGFLSFLFGKNDKSKRKPGSFENQHRPPPPDMSEEENADDDDNDDDDSDEEGEENRRKDTPTHFTGPEGKFEIGHLGNKPLPFNPDFKPPQKPQRPYKGSTSMEDSDEKRFRSPSSSPPPTRLAIPPTTPKTPELPRPILFLGKPHRIMIPPPATPPAPTQSTTLPTTTSTTAKTKDSEEDDEPESDEEKQSEESKEDDASKESKESDEDQGKKSKTTTFSKKSNKKKQEIPQPPPIAHYKPASSAATPTAPPKPSTTQSTKTRSDASDEKQNDDSNQTKEDDSAEEKGSKEEGSDEASSEEDDKEEKKKQRPSRPQRKPEDDELDNAPVLPPLPPVGGDIDAVEEILGTPTEDEKPEEQDPYNADEDIPAPPPLVQGFAASLEIQVPSNNAPPLIPPKNVAQQASQSVGVANQVQGGAPNSGVGSATGSRDPSQQLQGVRNPGSSSSNREPSSGNRNPGNNRQQQKPKENEGEKKTDNNKKENSSEEKEKSSEESSEEDFAKGVLTGFDFDSVALGPENPEDENDDTAAKDPPEPPPVFTGSPAQKHHLKLGSSHPRPVPHSKPHFYRPQISRNEAVQQQQSKLKPMRMPLRPMSQQNNRPSSSFSVSHLLRPLMTRPVYQRKPLDPKVVEWIRESYGIPDLNNQHNDDEHDQNQNHLPPHMRQPNRSGLESQDDKKETKAKSSEKKSKERKKKPIKNKSGEKSSNLDKSESGSESKLTSDYITEEQEADMAQALFNTSEEEELLNKSAAQKIAQTSTKSPSHSSNKSGEKRKSSAEDKNSSYEKRKHILILKPSSWEKQASSEQIKPSSLEILMSSFAGKGTLSSSAEKRKKNSSSEKIIKKSSSSEAKSSENKKSSSGERRKSTSSELHQSKPSTTKTSSFELRDRLNLPSSVERKKITSSREKSKSSSSEKNKASSEAKHRTKSSEKAKKPISISTRRILRPIITSRPKIVIRSKSVHKRPSFPGLPPIYGKQKLQG